jgi:carbonic anhydrase
MLSDPCSAELDVRLILVLGIASAARVKAAIKHIDDNDALPGSINGLVDLIRPAVTAVKNLQGNVLDNAIKANVERGVERLQHLEPLLVGSVKKGTLKVVGAVYDLHSGKVTLFG